MVELNLTMSKSKNMHRILKVSCGIGKENNKFTITDIKRGPNKKYSKWKGKEGA